MSRPVSGHEQEGTEIDPAWKRLLVRLKIFSLFEHSERKAFDFYANLRSQTLSLPPLPLLFSQERLAERREIHDLFAISAKRKYFVTAGHVARHDGNRSSKVNDHYADCIQRLEYETGNGSDDVNDGLPQYVFQLGGLYKITCMYITLVNTFS